MKRPLFVGNWKLHGTIDETLKRITELKHRVDPALDADLAVAPPFTALYSASVLLPETPFQLAAQNLFWETEGAYTGEISGLFLKELGCTYVLVGHSERRRLFGETDALVNKKLRAALAADLIPIFCLGETLEEREAGQTEAVVERQLKLGLQELHANDLKNMVLAYEPVWAIGTGRNATPGEAETVHRFLRNALAKAYDAPIAHGLRLLYGGSVTSKNAAALLQQKNVDGLLVGGASLDPAQMAEIVAAAPTKKEIG